MSIDLPHYDGSDERTLRSHLSLIHGVYVNDVKTVDGLIECHESSHAEPDYHFVMRHTHRDTVLEQSGEDVEEWSW